MIRSEPSLGEGGVRDRHLLIGPGRAVQSVRGGLRPAELLGSGARPPNQDAAADRGSRGGYRNMAR